MTPARASHDAGLRALLPARGTVTAALAEYVGMLAVLGGLILFLSLIHISEPTRPY